MPVTLKLTKLNKTRTHKSYNKPVLYFTDSVYKFITTPANSINWKLPVIKRKLLVKFL